MFLAAREPRSMKRQIFSAFFVAAIVFFWFSNTSVAQAATIVQSAQGTTVGASTSVSATLGAAATAGNLLIAVVGANGNTTISGPSGWSLAINQSGLVSQGIFYKLAAGGETTVTGTVSANPGSIGIHVYEYSGASSFMSSSSASGNSATPASGTVTTTVANELVFVGITVFRTSSIGDASWNDSGEGFSERRDFQTAGGGSGPDATYAGGDNLANSAGAKSVTVSSQSAEWRGQIVRFQGDTTPPAAVSNLALSNPTSSTMTLTWTAPGDDGTTGTATTYTIRRSTSPITNDTDFNGATNVTPSPPAPAIAGTVQTLTVTGLSASTTYYFAMKTSDEVPNISALSNAPGAATLPPPDITPPAAVSNLALSNPTTTTITLTWTAPGDDGTTGTAASYNIRRSNAPITSDGDFNAATSVSPSPPAPAIAGTVQTLTVTGLTAGTTYYFAMKTSDEVPNVSALSNAPGAATLPPPDTTPPAAISNLALSNPTTTTITLTWTAPGDDGTTGTASVYDFHYSTSPILSDSDYSAAPDVTPSPPAPAVAGTVQNMTVTGLSANTTYYFAVKTYDEVPNISALSNAPGLSTLPASDTTPPAAVSDLALSNPTTTTITLTWTAPGDDGSTGTAASYDIRYSTSVIVEGNFNSAVQVTGEPAPALAGTIQNMTVTGLVANTTYYFAMKTSDEAPNVSSLSNAPSLATSPAPDTTPPAAVSDLALSNPTTTTITLTWTAPGDDGTTGTAASYDIRYSSEYPISSDAVYNGATQAAGEPAPALAGTIQTMTVTGLTPNTNYWFGIKTADEAPNVSALSNSPSLATQPLPDTTAPAAVSDLALSNPTPSAITLTWTAPGDDGTTGTAAYFDIRYSTSPIANGAFATATQVSGEPVPALAGTIQTMTVSSLAANTTYYFAMKTADEVPNTSALSNNPSLATLPSPDVTAPAAVADLSVSSLTPTDFALSWTAPGDDGTTGTATVYDVRYSTGPIANGNFAAATQVAGEPAPALAGTTQSMNVTGLFAGTTYYFAMKTADEVPNTSALSNVAVFTPAAASTSGEGSRGGYVVLMTVAVKATPDKLPFGGGEVTFVYTVKNDGNVAVANVAVTDAVGTLPCEPKYVSGDTDADGMIDPGAEWLFSCTASVLKSGTHSVRAIGNWDLGSAASAYASAVVLVGDTASSASFHFHIRPFPAVLHSGGGISTLSYHVGNLGGTAMSDLRFSGDFCRLSDVLEGDENGNNLLDAGEMWEYACRGEFQVTTDLAVVLTAKIGDVELTDIATTKIIVGDPVPHPSIHLHAMSNPARIPYGGGTAYLTYRVYNDGNTPLEDIELLSGSSTCGKPAYQRGDLNADGILDLGEVWYYGCIEHLHETEADAPVVKGRAGTQWVSDDALFIIPVAKSPPPAEDRNAAGAYDPQMAADDTPDIDTALGLPAAAETAACTPGVAYKLPDDKNPRTQEDTTVYYCGRDGKRHAFLNARIFKSWFPDYTNVLVLERKDLEAIPLGASVVYRPGARMVKNTLDSRVYAVTREGGLRWIESEAKAAELYGPKWNTMIDDLPDVFWSDYGYGQFIR